MQTLIGYAKNSNEAAYKIFKQSNIEGDCNRFIEELMSINNDKGIYNSDFKG